MKNLLTKSDIKRIEAKDSLTTLDYRILRESTWAESGVQTACHNIIKAKYPADKVTFQQNDNGGTGNKAKKWGEGTQAGFPDVTIWLWNLKGASSQIFMEFKKVGGVIRPNQKKWHKFLIEKQQIAHFCNNSAFFEMVVCSQIDWFFKENKCERAGNVWL